MKYSMLKRLPIKLISIPCGAIRCDPEEIKLQIDAAFQFLVVRLDAEAFTIATRKIVISIPCGTIRSFIISPQTNPSGYFNSLWYD